MGVPRLNRFHATLTVGDILYNHHSIYEWAERCQASETSIGSLLKNSEEDAEKNTSYLVELYLQKKANHLREVGHLVMEGIFDHQTAYPKREEASQSYVDAVNKYLLDLLPTEAEMSSTEGTAKSFETWHIVRNTHDQIGMEVSGDTWKTKSRIQNSQKSILALGERATEE